MGIIAEFDNLGDYLKRDDLAGVPVPLVAEYLEVTSATVNAMLRDDRLDGVRVDETTLVTLASLRAREAQRANEENTVYEYLKGRAKEGTRVVFYEPVMNEIGLSTNVPAHRNRIGSILGSVSERSFKEHRVLLSVLVHRNTPGITRPGEGFFYLVKESDFAEEHDFECDNEDEFVERETDRVLEAYKDR